MYKKPAIKQQMMVCDIVIHDGFTPHFSKGNTTKFHRRALILNFRPKAMIDHERSKGIDHQGKRKVRNN